MCGACDAGPCQMLACVVAAGLPTSLSIYPRGEPTREPDCLRVVEIGRTIETMTVDISGESAKIQESVRQIAAHMPEIAALPRISPEIA